MKQFFSKILTGLLRLLGNSPKIILIFFSKITYFLLYYITTYRKKVVCENLKNSFPHKTDKERAKIRKLFYKHLSELFFESLFILQIKPKDVSKWVVLENKEVMEKYIRQGRDIALAAGHYGNWEMLSFMIPQLKDIQVLGIYKPLQNLALENFMKDIREKYGAKAVPMKQVFKYLFKYKKEGIPTGTLYIIDQTPHFYDIEYETQFLNQSTPVFLGPEKIAKKWDHVVVYASLQKKAFAQYSIRFHLITDKAKEMEQYAITEKYTKLLEKDIQNKPQYWLWSHRRWKYAKNRFNINN